MCVCKCIYVCASTHMHDKSGGHRLMLGVFLDCCPPYWLREGLSQLNSELISRANLSSQHTLECPVSAFLVLELQVGCHPPQQLCGCWGSQLWTDTCVVTTGYWFLKHYDERLTKNKYLLASLSDMCCHTDRNWYISDKLSFLLKDKILKKWYCHFSNTVITDPCKLECKLLLL